METLVNYALSAFPNTSFNTSVLSDQIAAATTVGQRLSFTVLDGPTVSLAFPGAVVGAAKTALDAVVAIHQGRPYGDATQTNNFMAMQSSDTGIDVAAVTLLTTPLPAGPYLLSWICEIATTNNTANSGVRAAIQSNISGSFADHFEKNVSAPAVGSPAWDVFTGTVLANINAIASTPSIRIVYKRIGASNPALIRRARIGITSVD